MGIDFLAFDVETANRNRGSICQIGLTIVADGAIVQTETLLCRPPESVSNFDSFNIRWHGISASTVAHASCAAKRRSLGGPGSTSPAQLSLWSDRGIDCPSYPVDKSGHGSAGAH